MQALHQRVPVGVDRQHRERQQLVDRAVLQYVSNGIWAAVGAHDAPAHGLAVFVVELEEVDRRDDTELLALPGVAEGRFAGHRPRSRVAGLAGQFVVGPGRNHTEHGGSDFKFAGHLMRAAQDWRHVAWPCFWRKIELKRSNTEAVFDLFFTAWRT